MELGWGAFWIVVSGEDWSIFGMCRKEEQEVCFGLGRIRKLVWEGQAVLLGPSTMAGRHHPKSGRIPYEQNPSCIPTVRLKADLTLPAPNPPASRSTMHSRELRSTPQPAVVSKPGMSERRLDRTRNFTGLRTSEHIWRSQEPPKNLHWTL